MKAVIQRVSRAAVRVDGATIGEIGRGLLVLLGIGKADTDATSDWMINKLLCLRIFPDEAGKMNRSVTDLGGGILVVSQFTLYGELQKGTRPSFSDAMPPAEAQNLYNSFMVKLRAATSLPVAEGKFAAMMDVELINDGPVTIILETPAKLPVERASRPFTPNEKTGGTPVPLFIPFDPELTATIHTKNLPHWEQSGCTYFITFRLADSLPKTKLDQWQTERDQWKRHHPPPHSAEQSQEYHRLFPARLEQWLDAGHGECILRQPPITTLMNQSLRYFDGQRYSLGEFVIMPNHVHVLMTPLGDWRLEQILHSWKSFTAHEINKLMGRQGAVWQDESFDHLVRNEQAIAQFAAYIQQNANLRSSIEMNGRDARSTTD